MVRLRKAFEKSSDSFNNLKDSKKIDKALKTIKEPIDDFKNKSKNIENLLSSIKSIKIEKRKNSRNKIMGWITKWLWTKTITRSNI